jgi:hypothetical protein
MTLYFLRAPNNHLKVGISDNFPNRLDQIRRGNSHEPIEVVQTFSADRETIVQLERDIHAELDSSRLHHEWFEWNEQAEAVISRLMRQFYPERYVLQDLGK